MGPEDAAPQAAVKTGRPLPAIPPNEPPVQHGSPKAERRSASISSQKSLTRKPLASQMNGNSSPSAVRGGHVPRQSGSSVTHSLDRHSRANSINGTADTPVTVSIPLRQRHIHDGPISPRFSHAAEIVNAAQLAENDEAIYNDSRELTSSPQQVPEISPPPLQYHHQPYDEFMAVSEQRNTNDFDQPEGSPNQYPYDLQPPPPRTSSKRPSSAYTLGSDLNARGRTHSPHLSVGGSSPGSPLAVPRARSAQRLSPENRPVSYVDLLNVPYPQQVAPTPNLADNFLNNAVGANAARLDTKKTLEMYRANVKKTQDSAVQYEFAIWMVQIYQDIKATGPEGDTYGLDPAELVKEARQILQRLADRGHPFAQYYLGDGYASGLFNKGKEDYDRAFPLFVAASKHGHAEAGYRAALCYEFGWGCRKDYAKAVQFYRASATKNHPGAATRLGKACLTGDMGLANRYREGIKWLKRAAESADHQYNSAPYELGLMHEVGYGDDVFKDEVYAAQLFTQAADLGHAQANLKMGEAYEHGLLSCPKDPALSVHFYNGAAQAGLPEAMMNLCAWYMVGAEPVLEKDEMEAYEWAKRAAELGLPKAQYAVGYFTEMGIGCRRDPLEANRWYVQAAEKGEERAKQRLAIIQAAASGEPEYRSAVAKAKAKKGDKEDKDCIVM